MIKQAKQSRFVSAAEIAQQLDVSKGHIYNMVRNGQIPHMRIGKKLIKFDREKIAQWIEARENAGNGTESRSGENS